MGWHANGNGPDSLVDALIAGGSALFAVWAGTGTIVWQAGLIAFGVAFFASLGASRRRGGATKPS